MLSSELPKTYDPSVTEQKIYQSWIEGDYFVAKIDPSKTPFTVIMPPPNVTGELHYGHALTIALEDLMSRWHRMKGDPTLYLPGTDHAGIATQVVVERMLSKENRTRHELGRKQFIETVWQWVHQYGGRIYEQIERLGASCDWSRQAFTLDPGPSKAVRETFVNLYNKGLIYRGERIVTWCPRCSTALSDLEVKHQEENGALYYIRYLLKNSADSLIIATTRPETLLGDTAISVNPNDDRYTQYVGESAIVPLVNRSIPIIADEAVDPEFGTGALKVTPSHDINDFEIRERHNLELLNVMNLDGTMNVNAGKYDGIDRFKAREQIVNELEQSELLVKTEDYHHAIGHCDRCAEIVEPLVSKQWYMKMEPLAKPAIDAVENGQIRIVPERFSKLFFNWMHIFRDWCICRQLWWGHQIPAWYCQGCAQIIVAIDDPVACTSCDSADLERDPDVLDTWFSSALWPHSTLGWPDATEDLDYFYPSTVMETGHDILFFWVARMIMTGIENTGNIPFNTVYLHGLVRDPDGAKMSKSKGNVKDPLDLIDIYGADALRFALTTGNSPGNDMRLTDSKLQSSRNFTNKLWNAARFVISNIERSDVHITWNIPAPGHVEDRWILSRLNRIASEIDHYMNEFQFGEAQREIHDFFWGEYCDWYLEMSKIRIRSGDESPIPILVYVLEKILRLLHPFMPFITEETWQTLVQYLPGDPESPALMVAEYPIAETNLYDEQAEVDIAAVIELVRAIRNVRAEFRIQAGQPVEAIVQAPEITDVLTNEKAVIKVLAQVEPLLINQEIKDTSPKDHVSMVLSNGTVAIPLGEIVDLSQEKQRLAQELDKISQNLAGLSNRLADEKFLSRAPEEVIERERERLGVIENRRDRVRETLARIQD